MNDDEWGSTYPQVQDEPPLDGDPLGVTAIVIGCIGIVLAGIVLAIVTGVLAAVAGSQARANGKSLENAYIAFGLAAIDGVVWLVLHMIFDLNFLAG